jgi:phenylalanyl-tRNA synthetase beta chain
MLISIRWLKNYVDIPVDTLALVEDLTMIGNNVEHCTAHGVIPPELIIGKVLSADKHPNADRLTLCVVQLGEGEASEIICGAPNVAAGQFVPVAVPGTTLPNGMKIKKSKIRGVVSNGMICSETELGLGDDASGIIVLDGEFEPGTPFHQVMPPGDEVLEIEVTPNRPDLLSHIGIAREVSALYKTPLKLPFKEIPVGGAADFGIEIADGNDCPRYVGRMIRGVKVGPSPSWLVNALEAVELRSVNNIVDM